MNRRQNKLKDFIVLTTQRTGSTWLIDVLNSHPNIHAYDELFLRERPLDSPWGAQGRVYFETYLCAQRLGKLTVAEPWYALRYAYSLFSQPRSDHAFGFKLMYNQLYSRRHLTLYPFIVARGISIIHLIRENLLDVIISQTAALKSGIYHVHDGVPTNPTLISLDTTRLIDQLNGFSCRIARTRRLFAARRLPYLEVSYESLVGNPQLLTNICTFLGADGSQAVLQSTMGKLNPTSQSQLVANYSAVAKTLAGSPFEHMLRP